MNPSTSVHLLREALIVLPITRQQASRYALQLLSLLRRQGNFDLPYRLQLRTLKLFGD